MLERVRQAELASLARFAAIVFSWAVTVEEAVEEWNAFRRLASQPKRKRNREKAMNISTDS